MKSDECPPIADMELAQLLLADMGSFSPEEYQLFAKALQRKHYFSGEKLLRKGEVCQTVYFVNEGACLQYSDHDGDAQNIIDLYSSGEWMTNTESLIKQLPSATTIEVFSDAVVYALSIQQVHVLIQINPSFFRLGKLLEPHHPRTQFFDHNMTPLQKYQYVLDNRPQLLQNFPLKIVASYLKMTPETLSRVREKIAKGIS